MEEKFKLHIDTIGYKDKEFSKNEEEMKKLKYRLQGASSPIEVTIPQLVEAIQQGRTISPAVMKGTKAEDFVEQQVFMVDIDNKNTDVPLLTVKEALSICKKNCLPLAFYYFSFSHTEKIPKYRLVFVMNEVITDHILRDTITRKLIDLFEQADTSCKNADRVFLGTDKKAVICDLEARITVDDVMKISPKSVIAKKKKSTSRSDKELEKLINDFDFFSYLKERNGNIVRDNPRYIMFENCEICRPHNDLVYYPETNSFNCFSDDGDVGGTIIDYLMAVDKLTVAEAIKKFKKELCRMKKKLKTFKMSDIKIKEVKWLWYPYIPAGKLTVLQGNPDDGKTHFVLQIASIVTNGGKFPTGKSDIESGNIIFQTAEDGLADTIKPRLLHAGANDEKVVVIDESEEPLSLVDNRIEEAIIEYNAKLMIIDPLQAYLGADVDMHRANEIRPVMHYLSDVAERTDCAIILIGHMSKADTKGIYKGLGSIDITAAARSVLLLGRNPKNENIRAVVPLKSSLAPEGKAVAFELNPDTGFRWLGESKLTAKEILSDSKKDKKESSEVKEAKKYILDLFSDSDDILVSEAKELLINVHGFSETSIRKAREQLGIETYSKGFKPKEYHWRIPKEDT